MPPKCSSDCGCAGAQYADLCNFEPSCPTCQMMRDRLDRYGVVVAEHINLLNLLGINDKEN